LQRPAGYGVPVRTSSSAAHPNEILAQRLLEGAIAQGERLVTGGSPSCSDPDFRARSARRF